MVSTYLTYDLRRIPARARLGSRSALAITRSGAGVDLPGLRRNSMPRSDDEQDNDARDSSPAARGGDVSFGANARRDARDRESSRAWRPADFPAIALFVNSMVKCHEDVPRHIWGLFQALGIQYRWILTLDALGCALVSTADLAIDDAKENAWMALHEHERDLLEGKMYQRLVSLWSEFSDDLAVFDANGPDQLLRAQKVLGKPSLLLSLLSTSVCKLSSSLARSEA